MKTVVIRIGKLVAGQFPVRLYFNDENEFWYEQHQAESFIPEGLVRKEPVIDPITKDGAPLDEATVKKFFSDEAEGDDERFKAIGKYLYRLVFHGDVKKRWDQLRAQYPGEPQGSEGLRTILDIEPSNLQALPWELMGEELRLFLDTSNPFSRGCIDFKSNVPKHTWPLRALIIIGTSRKESGIDAELEAESIAGALREISRTIEVDIMRRRSKSDLAKQYKNLRPHIVHFIGHGGIEGKNPYLRIHDSEDKPQNWTVDEIANLGSTGWAASFAFINACRSGDKIGIEGTWEIAEAFRKARIPSVLSMLGDIKEEAAQTFAAGVYEGLAQNRPLDQAVAAARYDVSNCQNAGLATKQWALASLHCSVPPDKVFAIDYKIPSHRQNEIKDDKELGQLQGFVDRLEQRLTISQNVDPDPHPAAENGINKSLLVVKGGTSIGKSSMVKLCLECCAMRGRKFSWVNAEKGKDGSRTFLEVLRFIRDGDPFRGSLLCCSLDEQGAFSHFNFELEHILLKRTPDTSEIPQNYQEKKSIKTSAWNGTYEHQVYLFSLFREALQKAAGEVPLVIVLDNMEIEPGDFNTVLVPHLILPIKRGEVKNVKLILVLSQKNETEYDLKQLGHYETIVVSKFKKEDFVPLALEFIRYKKNPFVQHRDHVKRIVNTMDETAIGEYWGPEHLNTVFGWVEQAGRLRSS